MTQEDVIEILERFVIGAKPCSQREIVDACASAYRMLKEQPSPPSNLDDVAENHMLSITTLAFDERDVILSFKAGAEWREAQISKLSDNLDDAAWNYVAKKYGIKEPEKIFENEEIAEDFKAGAEWMAGQGWSRELEVKEDAGGYPYIDKHIELYDYDTDEPLANKGDKVVVQIRKK